MPEEYKDTMMIVMCNDCHKYSKVKFHIMGGKCDSCKSYNTTRTTDVEGQKKLDDKKKIILNLSKM